MSMNLLTLFALSAAIASPLGALPADPRCEIAPDAIAAQAPEIASVRLVREATHIVLATALDTRSPDTNSTDDRVHFRVNEVLKGDLSASLWLQGRLGGEDDLNAGPVPYARVRSTALDGGCDARRYKAGATYLLFLQDGGDGLTPYWAPLAPVNEQISSDLDEWLLWTKGVIAGLGARGR
jgi:hypothetical protein